MTRTEEISKEALYMGTAECVKCLYFKQVDVNKRTGECHINPPQVNGDARPFPPVGEEEWCGKFLVDSDEEG